MTEQDYSYLIPGQKYRITYRPNYARTDREMVGMVMEVDDFNTIHLSGRPAYGTVELPGRWVKEAEKVGDGEEPYCERKVKEG